MEKTSVKGASFEGVLENYAFQHSGAKIRVFFNKTQTSLQFGFFLFSDSP